MTFATFDQNDEGIWTDQEKDNDKGKYKDNDNDKDKYIQKTQSKSDPRDLWPPQHFETFDQGDKESLLRTQ